VESLFVANRTDQSASTVGDALTRWGERELRLRSSTCASLAAMASYHKSGSLARHRCHRDHRLRQHQSAVEAVKLGAVDYLTKPFEPSGCSSPRSVPSSAAA
jgi:hypothetical protein